MINNAVAVSIELCGKVPKRGIFETAVLDHGTWEVMKNLFLDQYPAPNFEMEQQVIAVHRTQGEQESVYDYMENKARLWQRVDPGITNRLLLGHIRMDLRPEIRSRLT